MLQRHQAGILASHPKRPDQTARLQGSSVTGLQGIRELHSCSTVKIGSEKIRLQTPRLPEATMSSIQEPHLHLEVGHILFTRFRKNPTGPKKAEAMNVALIT
jgi:hypothetical protein